MPTYLNVDYAQRGAVKALGAKWDAQARKWYVPDGRDLAAFNTWLPADLRSTEVTLSESASGAVQVRRRGKTLSQLLAGVADVVAHAYQQGEWTIVDVVQATVKNHVFLEVAERDADGVVLAKASAMLWANVANEILPAFETATGMSIGPGMKLLVRARPVFSSQYGFRLFIDAIDPDFTLGELEARKREIRARLQQQGLWGANKALHFPWDFNAVLVVAPADAAGLGDFRAEAERLERHNVCRFIYAHSRFQGQGAAEEIIATTRTALAALRQDTLDAVVLIRGGGAVNDLAWLSNYELARFVCELRYPVLTGIGHERDTTILDEVAHTSFDTPSKVIAGIEATIAKRAREAQAAFTDIVAATQRQIGQVRGIAENSNNSVRAGAIRQIYLARTASAEAMTDLRLSALRGVASAGERARDLVRAVHAQSGTQLAVAKQRAPLLLTQIRDQARLHVRTAASQSQQALSSVLDRGKAESGRAGRDIGLLITGALHDARQRLIGARSSAEALMREVSGQGPQKTLARGFAHVRDPQGRTVMSASAVNTGNEITVTFHDGAVLAKVESKESKR